MESKLKILITDDVVTDRRFMVRLISEFNNVELIGTAPSGKIALAKIELKKPDLIFLDLIMPEMDGIETLKEIRKRFPDLDVVIVSGIDQEKAEMTMQALALGALDFLPKPSRVSNHSGLNDLKKALARIVSMGLTRKYSRMARMISNRKYMLLEKEKEFPKKRIIQTQPELKRKNREEKPVRGGIRKPGIIDVVVIGVSTGGPHALQKLIPRLNPNLPVPVLVVQHMPPMFTASLALRMDAQSEVPVREGAKDMAAEAGWVYIAPGGLHMVARKKSDSNRIVIDIDNSSPVNSCKPSVDVLFQSVASIFGKRVLAVVLTGMGSDGTRGVAEIRNEGGYTIVQDEKSSVVWGMPGSVVEAGLADEILPLDQIAGRINQLAWKGHR